ncbi:MAG: SUMF1/EgtB/PvdO family nonheme iron enzyme [Lewinellaceae bacterium]|nr:SUMF1/EgtB/PvdO family nonheme iron enzyme [Phaeodactylibacter sp.]MCB9352106.1 SUMF1/EgtB/PvdO family nonheme iron enzyme [Lewinellaceae bacterium]
MSKKRRWELRHDMLAPKIWARLPQQDRVLRQIHRSLAQRQADYAEGKGSLLGEPELDAWRAYRPKLAEMEEVAPAVLQYFDDSEAALKQAQEEKKRKQQEDLEKEKHLRAQAETAKTQAQQAQQQAEENAGIATANATRAERRTRIAAVLAVLAGVMLVIAVQQCNDANSSNRQLEKAVADRDTTNQRLKKTYADLNIAYQQLGEEKQTSQQRAEELEVTNSQLEESQERIKIEQNNTQRALNSLKDYAREAMPVLRRDIDNLILHLNYDSALAQCKIAWNLNEGALEIERRFQEVAYFFTESHTYDKAEEALDYIRRRPAKPGDPGERAAKLREAVKEIDFKYWRDTLEKRYYPEMVHVEGGTFKMGCDEEKLKKVFGENQECPESEKKHTVRLKSYRIARTETTVWQYALYYASEGRDFFKDGPYTPAWGWQGNHPVVNVSWYYALAYAEWLTAQQKQRGENLERVYKGLGEIPEDPNKLDTLNINWNKMADWEANGYRLPTEAEWEYAARGGQPGKSNNYIFAGSDTAAPVAVYGEGGGTSPVRKKRKNDLGLYDMSGNVYEWCWDWYSSDYYSNPKASANPHGPETTGYRVLRGGSWFSLTNNLRSSNRDLNDPVLRSSGDGFRLSQGY